MTSFQNGIPPSPSENTVYIAFCVDDHYFRSMGATIASLIDNNSEMHFSFHIFAFEVSEENQYRLRQLENTFDVTTQIHLINPDVFHEFSDFICSSYYSASIFTRLLIPALMQGITEKILYLDADILCLGKIDELININISNDIALVVSDAETTIKKRSVALKLSQKKYFNSGVMYMNIALWIKNKITEKTIAAILENGEKFRFPDQDALNLVLDGHVRYTDKKWNFLYGLVGDLENNRTKMLSIGDARLIHFAGSVKPWSDWHLHESKDIFKKYHAMSPWADLPIDVVPQNHKEMRMHSRFLLRRGQRMESFRWYLKYLSARLKK